MVENQPGCFRFHLLLFAFLGVACFMARVRFNPSIMALRGKVGKWIYRLWYGKQVRQKAPKRSKRKLSPLQLAQVERFTVAAHAAPAMLNAHKATCRRLAWKLAKSEISVAHRACYYHIPLDETPGKQPPAP
jgi:hypothetical protein